MKFFITLIICQLLSSFSSFSNEAGSNAILLKCAKETLRSFGKAKEVNYLNTETKESVEGKLIFNGEVYKVVAGTICLNGSLINMAKASGYLSINYNQTGSFNLEWNLESCEARSTESNDCK